MSEYNDSVLTTQGLELAKRALLGTTKFQLTRATATGADLNAVQLESLLTLPDEQVGLVTEADGGGSMIDHTIATVEILFTNEGLAAGYDVTAIGIYALEDGADSEILYAVMTAKTGHAEYLPDYADKVLAEFKVTSMIVVGNVDAVSVAIDLDTLASKQFVYNQLNPPALNNLSFGVDTSGLGYTDYPRFKAWGYYNGAGIAQKVSYAGVPRMYDLYMAADLTNNGAVMIPKFLTAQIKTLLPELDPTCLLANRSTDGRWMYLFCDPEKVKYSPTIGIQCLNATFKEVV